VVDGIRALGPCLLERTFNSVRPSINIGSDHVRHSSSHPDERIHASDECK
jgi:hypothetical protein